MKNKNFAICDFEMAYAQKMAEYFWDKVKRSFQMHLFTEPEELQRFVEEEKIEILLAAESFLQPLEEKVLRQGVSHIFVLQETGKVMPEDFCCINKYQSPDDIFKIMTEVSERFANALEVRQVINDVCMIGIYSPIRRCLQTPFALTMGQLLAKEHRVLYMNFECYSGLRQMLNREFSTDMMDVMYYFRNAKEKLAVKLPSVIQNINGMDYIPPVQSPLDLHEVNGKQWGDFCQEISAVGEYEYLILDLDDGMNGLFDLLRQCERIYTIIKEDKFAAAKIVQYEHVLRFHELDEIARKTVKCKFPVFQRIAEDIELMTHGELANYVRAIIKENLYGQDKGQG